MGYNTNNPDKPKSKAKVMCPYCGSPDTELFSLFGQQLLTVQYYCNACHTPFECIKDDDILDDYYISDRLSEARTSFVAGRDKINYATRKEDQP
jgi:DNA-directed RNA polymerase subunit RPC12/RpoP